MSIGKFCTRNVVTAREDETVFDIAKKMREKNVGAVVIVDAGRAPIGIITDRDIAIKGVARGKDPKTTPLTAIMSEDVVAVSEERGLFEITHIMREREIRRLPVVDEEGKLTGMITLDDLIMVLGEEVAGLAETIAYETFAGKKTGLPR